MIAEKAHTLEEIRREEGVATALQKVAAHSYNHILPGVRAGAILKISGGLGLQHPETGQDVNSYRHKGGETIQIDQPQGIGPVPDVIQKQVGTHQIPPRDIFEVKNAKIAGRTPQRMTEKGRFIFDRPFRKETVRRDIRRDIRDTNVFSVFRNQILKEPILNLDKAVLYNRSTAFHHWFCEFLTQLQVIDEHVVNPEGNINIIIPADSPSWVYESLNYLEYNQNSIVDWDGDPMSISCLFIPIPRFVGGVDGWKIFSQSACEWLRDRLQAQAKKESTLWGETPQRVYISRNDAEQRRLENETELMASLSEFGFKKYQLTQLSILDQVSLFSNANLVVGPHGAGLTNILYSEDLSVIELFGNPETDIKIGPHYCLLSNTLDFDYRYMICDSDNKDINVDIASAVEVIKSVIQHTI